jgi:hypothetical protein
MNTLTQLTDSYKAAIRDTHQTMMLAALALADELAQNGPERSASLTRDYVAAKLAALAAVRDLDVHTATLAQIS